MHRPLTSDLATAGILERRRQPGARHATLRVTHRFLDHAEAQALTGSRPATHGQPQDAATVLLQRALATWDAFHGDPREAALLLRDFLDRRDQLGNLAPAFPPLTAFAAA